jgi:hypothetical protein
MWTGIGSRASSWWTSDQLTHDFHVTPRLVVRRRLASGFSAGSRQFFNMKEFHMGTMRPTEGRADEFDLVELYASFEQLCEEEGPGAADEGELADLKRAMTDAYLRMDVAAFLDALSKAMSLRDGIRYESHRPVEDR